MTRGVRETTSRGSTTRSHLPQKRRRTLASSTRFAPEPVRAPRKRLARTVCNLTAGHRLRRDAPPAGCEGASGSVSRVVGATSPGRKQRQVDAIRRRCRLPAREISDFVRGLRGLDRAQRHESSRVRPDSVLCCIVQRFTGQPMIPCRSRSQARGRGDAGTVRSTRKRAETSRVTTGWAASESVWLTRMDEGAPGRGSRVRFTLCEVKRSWLCELRRALLIHLRLVPLAARQGRQRWRGYIALGEKKTLDRGGAVTTEARNGVVKRRPHRCSLVARRGVHAETNRIRVPVKYRRMGRSRSYASLFRRSIPAERRRAGHRRI